MTRTVRSIPGVSMKVRIACAKALNEAFQIQQAARRRSPPRIREVRMKRLLVLKSVHAASLARAARYVKDSYSTGQGKGDISDGWARANERALEALRAAPTRSADRDAKALADVLDAALGNSCSCVSDDVEGKYHGAPIHKASGHARDCWIASSHKQIERVRELIKLLRGEE